MGHSLYQTFDKRYPMVERAEGVCLYDAEGKRYIDCSAGAAVANIGHGVQEVVDAICEQGRKVSYVYGNMFTSAARERLCSQVIEASPTGMDRVFFCSGGSEAVESALKIARQYQIEMGRSEKYKVISRWQSYHGATIMALSLGGRPSWRSKYEPYLTRMPHIAQCNCYRCPYGAQYPGCKLACARELERVVRYEGSETVSAFIVEPITGTTSTATKPPDGYMQIIRETCDKYDMLLIVDEVITGLGRTGKNFAVDHYGVTPDVITVAKGLGGGYVPIGATIVHQKVVDAIAKGTGNMQHSFTFANMPVVCAGASAVLKYTKDHDLVNRAATMGKVFLDKLKAKLDNLPMVGEVTGTGLLIGVEIVKDKETKEPYPSSSSMGGAIADRCFDDGLILLGGVLGVADGVVGDRLQLSPPLVIEEPEMDEAADILGAAIVSCTSGL